MFISITRIYKCPARFSRDDAAHFGEMWREINTTHVNKMYRCYWSIKDLYHLIFFISY